MKKEYWQLHAAFPFCSRQAHARRRKNSLFLKPGSPDSSSNYRLAIRAWGRRACLRRVCLHRALRQDSPRLLSQREK